MKTVLGMFGIVCLVVCWGPVSEASAQSNTVDGIHWFTWPDDSRVNDCKGNCGAGCSDTLAVCGGAQHWELTVLWSEFLGRIAPSEGFQPMWEENYCTFGWVYLDEYDAYQGVGRWTYHGVYSHWCSNHDWSCWAFPFWCVFPITIEWACVDSHPEDWSYDVWMYGDANPTRNYLYLECRSDF
jgi:hypothetical protein